METVCDYEVGKSHSESTSLVTEHVLRIEIKLF